MLSYSSIRMTQDYRVILKLIDSIHFSYITEQRSKKQNGKVLRLEYGSKTCTLRKEVLEMWIRRKTAGVNWMVRSRNERILTRIGEKGNVMNDQPDEECNRRSDKRKEK